MRKMLTTADCQTAGYRSPEVTVTEIYAEGVLCASAVGSNLSVQTWDVEEDISW